ncbi:MAG: hypothetical protein SNG27_03470 [Rikenellaceae bacterium]
MIFVFPTELEAQLFIERSPISRVEISGVGMAACGAKVAQIASENPHDALILAGIAGSYDLNGVALCEVVEVCEESIEELPEKYAKRYVNEPLFGDLKGVISNSVSGSGHSSCTAQIENMEGASLFAICEALGVRCSQIRAISNRVGDPFAEWNIDGALDALTEKLIEISNS